jgi:type II secretory pathway predicted ATPase ExeA
MPAYLKFYDLERSAFDADSQSKVVLGTKALRDALSAVRSGLEDGATRICVNGDSGMGKTSLARALPKLLDDVRVAVVLHPTTSWNTIRSSIAKQWRLGEGGLARSNLVQFARESRLVLVVDQAETATTDILDHLDVLLSYRMEDNQPVVQSVLFANLAARGEEPPPLVWWLDRIQTLELQFAPLPREGVGSYIQKHLKRAGWTQGALFSADAASAIHGYTGGIPGEVDRVCESLLDEAARRNLRSIDASFVHEQLDDQADEDSTAYDTFEELVMEDAFAGAEESGTVDPEPQPSLQQTLEHFASPESDSNDANLLSVSEFEPRSDEATKADDECEESIASDGPVDEEPSTAAVAVESQGIHDETEDEAPVLESLDAAGADAADVSERDGADVERAEDRPDPAMVELEAYLSRPPTAEELRTLASERLRHRARTAALVALALVIGVVVILGWGKGDETKASNDPETRTKVAAEFPTVGPTPTVFADPEGLSVATPDKPVLARLRGPVAPSPASDARKPTDAASSDPSASKAAPAAPGAPLGDAETP